jgi:hypothetical protein
MVVDCRDPVRFHRLPFVLSVDPTVALDLDDQMERVVVRSTGAIL